MVYYSISLFNVLWCKCELTLSLSVFDCVCQISKTGTNSHYIIVLPLFPLPLFLLLLWHCIVTNIFYIDVVSTRVFLMHTCLWVCEHVHLCVCFWDHGLYVHDAMWPWWAWLCKHGVCVCMCVERLVPMVDCLVWALQRDRDIIP